uniref:transposase n=1 Tax=Caloramator sp. Dgby_cultured_2 TaxID=3029174 RepID=UPI0031597F48
MEVEGKILNATISRTPTGKYFVSICCRIEKTIEKSKTNKVIGIDLGVKHFLIDSEGNKISNPKYLIKLEKDLLRNKGSFLKTIR